MGLTEHTEALKLFEVWYEQEMPRLYNYISYQVHDEGIAEEITASICEKALSRLHQYDSARGEMKAWMFGIARNEIRGHWRSIKNRPAMISLDSLPEIRTESQSVEAGYETQEDFLRVLNQIATLTERDQEIIALRYGAGMSNQEIATVTGKSENYVAVLLYRTLKKLRMKLAAESASRKQGKHDV